MPPNTAAVAYLPTASAESVTESGKPLAKAEGVERVEPADDHIACELAAGSYRFEMDWKR